MFIYTYFNEDGSVGSVHIIDEEHNDINQVEEKAKEYNKECGREAYKIFAIPDELEESILFLFGGKRYKRYADIDDIENRMYELSASIEDLHDDAFSMSEAMDNIKRDFEKIKKYFDGE